MNTMYWAKFVDCAFLLYSHRRVGAMKLDGYSETGHLITLGESRTRYV